MRWLINILKSRSFLIVLGILLLIVLLWFLGNEFGWDSKYFLMGVIGVLVMSLLLAVVGLMRAGRSAEAIKASIQQQAEQQWLGTRPDKQPEIDQLRKRLGQAIAYIEGSQLGPGQGGLGQKLLRKLPWYKSSALYSLPWYLFIGPPASGKTTAIDNSGLYFPGGTDRVRGVGGTRNCDWYFSDQGIFLDTAGRYTTADEDSEEWLAFLDMLKQHRRKQPINGVIVGISIEELSRATPDDIERHADNIRRRLDELMQRLQIRFPVYLLFLKCDLIQGFVEFFGELSRKEREQIWGYTLDKEQHDNPDIGAVFEGEFQRLAATLVNRRLVRLRHPAKAEERKQLYIFPKQFASVKENLSQFVRRLFQPNPYQGGPRGGPLLRGFYFTSGTQEGVPIDYVIQAIAEKIGLPPEITAGFDPEIETKSYFIKDVFNNVIIPDRYLVRPHGGISSFRVAAVAAVLLGLFVTITGLALRSSSRYLTRVSNAAQNLANIRWDNPDSLGRNLARLDNLDQVLEDGNKLTSKWYQISGFDRRSSVNDHASALHRREVRAFIEAYPFAAIRRELEQARLPDGETLTDSVKDALRGHLQAYRLMTDSVAKLIKDEGFQDDLGSRLLLGTRDYLSTDSVASRDLVERQVASYIDGLSRTEAPIPPFTANPVVIDDVCSAIYEAPGPDLIYSRIKRESIRRFPAVTLRSILQSPEGYFEQPYPEVPGIFTRAAQKHVTEEIEKASADPRRGDWGCGIAEHAPTLALDPDELEAQLIDLYFSEYADAWTRFLGQIRHRSFGDVKTAADRLSRLGNEQQSPLFDLLKRVNFETQIERSVLESTREGIKNWVTRLRDRIGIASGQEEPVYAPVAERFSSLHTLFEENEDWATPLFESLAELGSELGDLNNEGAYDYAVSVLGNSEHSLSSKLRIIEGLLKGVPPGITALFEQPIRRSWESIIHNTQAYLNERWSEDVCVPFNESLAGRYPFNPASNQDAPLGNFRDFFRPGNGQIAKFRGEVLAPLLSSRGSQLEPMKWPSASGVGISISEEARRTFEQATMITNALFQNGEPRLEFTVEPKDPLRAQGAPSVGKVIIRVHGTEYPWDAQRWDIYGSLSWPGEAGASLSVPETSDLPLKAIEKTGPWAWFRLLNAADNIDALDRSKYLVSWAFVEGVTVRWQVDMGSDLVPLDRLEEFFAFQCHPPMSNAVP